MKEAGKRAESCDYELDYERFGLTKHWEGLREALKASRRNELYMNGRDYLAKRG